ncbi:MAG: hypothetical protein VX938_12245, partial [Myxococcota bacterium]|nr:hypothetical protein [Myxococcota bacterium]
EALINVGAEADRQPAVGDLGFGRYVVQWGQDGNDLLVSRLSDRLGSREGEEFHIPETSFIPLTFNMGIATHPSGDYFLLSFSGSYKCVQNANTNCSVNGRVYGSHYDVNGEIFGVAHLWSILGEKGGDGSLTSLELGQRIVPLAFDDITFGCVVTTVTNGNQPTDPPAGDVYLYPIAGDLSAGDRVLLLGADEVYSERFDASRISTDDQIQLAWISSDESEVRSGRFDRYGNPLGEAWIASVAGAGERFTNLALVTRPDHSVAIAWELETDDPDATDGINTDILLGIFDEDGTALLDAPVAVNTQTSGQQLLRGIDTFADGGLVTVFDDSKGDVSGWAIQARRFEPSGVPAANPERVNVIADGDQTLSTVRVLGSGEWVVAFVGDDGSVLTRRFYKTGEPSIGALEVQVNENGDGDQLNPDAAWWDDRALVVHEGPLEGNGGSEIAGRLYDVAGQPITSTFRINDNLTGLQSAPAVDAGADQFVVAWVEDAQDGESTRVHARRVDLLGTPQGDGFAVAPDVTGAQSQPQVAVSSDGRFAVTWIQTVGDSSQVYVRTWDADGIPSSEAQALDASSNDEQLAPQLTVTGDGDLVVVWESSPAGSKNDVHGRKLSLNGELLSDVVELGAAESDSAEQITPTVEVGLDNVGIACWQSSLLKGDGAKKGVG